MVDLNYESPGGPRTLRGPDREWERVADSLGARFVPASASPTNRRTLSIPSHPWTITIDAASGFLRADAVYVPRDRFQFRIDLYELPMGRLRRFLVRPLPFRHRVQVGVSWVDGRTFIWCGDPDRIRRLLTRTAFGEILLRQRSGTLRLAPSRTAPQFEMIRFRTPFGSSPGEFEGARLSGAGDVIRSALNHLSEIGAASDEAPPEGH